MTGFIQRTGIYHDDRVCGSESRHDQRRLQRTSEKVLMLLIRSDKITKPSLKSLDSTNPQSDRLCTNGGNSRPLLNKDQSKAERVSVCELAALPSLTSTQLKTFLTLTRVNVHEPSIRTTRMYKKKALQIDNRLVKIMRTRLLEKV